MRDALLDVLLKRPEPRVGFVVGVVVAVGLHVAVVPGARVLPLKALGDRSGSMSVAMGARAPAAAQQRVALELSVKAPTKKAEQVPVEPEPTGQVVSLPPSTAEAPLAADYLSETNQKAERETRARVTGATPVHTRAPQQASERQVARGSALAGETVTSTDRENGGPRGDGGSTSGDAVAWDSRTPGGGADQLALEVPRIKAVKALDLPRTADGDLQLQKERLGIDGNSDHLRLAMGRLQASTDVGTGDGSGAGRAGGGGGEGLPGHVAVPTLAQTERLSGLPANDHLLLEEDDATSLNAFEWKHATYFNRVADAIRRVWVGGEVLGQSDPDGSVFGFEDRLTTVEVSIDEGGNVVDIVIKDPSGAGPLDDEALRSFRVAGPFPNPPKALFQGRERYSFQFGFAVNYNRSTLDLNWRPY